MYSKVFFSYICVKIILCVSEVVCEQNDNQMNVLEFRYHDNNSLERFLRNFTRDNSDLTTLYSIGKSVKKREIWVVNITAVKETSLLIPNIKLLANIHGDEAAGREILLHFITYLVRSYRKGDKTVKHILENYKVHILPSLNPDGFEHANEGRCSNGPGRYNAKGTDLNRNFPDCFRNNSIPHQPETNAIMKWMKEVKFILSASLHGGAMVANYPYESVKEDLLPSESKSPDDDVFQKLALVYSLNHPQMHSGRPCPDIKEEFPNGITNGAAWYPLTGGMQDYNYAMHGCMEITLEVSCCKYPIASQLKKLWEDNKNSLEQYCLMAGFGVKGIIRDKFTMEPITKANLTIQGRDMIFHPSDKGEFYRILLPGQYKLIVITDEYARKVIKFNVSNPQPGEYATMTILLVYLGYSEDIDENETTRSPVTEITLKTEIHTLKTTAYERITTESTPKDVKFVAHHLIASNGEEVYKSSVFILLTITNLIIVAFNYLSNNQ